MSTRSDSSVRHRDVRRTTGRQRAAGVRLLAIAAALIAIGVVIVLALPTGGTSEGIGVAFIVLGSVPAVVGLGLMLAAIVERRSDRGAPWA